MRLHHLMSFLPLKNLPSTLASAFIPMVKDLKYVHTSHLVQTQVLSLLLQNSGAFFFFLSKHIFWFLELEAHSTNDSLCMQVVMLSTRIAAMDQSTVPNTHLCATTAFVPASHFRMIAWPGSCRKYQLRILRGFLHNRYLCPPSPSVDLLPFCNFTSSLPWDLTLTLKSPPPQQKKNPQKYCGVPARKKGKNKKKFLQFKD